MLVPLQAACRVLLPDVYGCVLVLLQGAHARC